MVNRPFDMLNEAIGKEVMVLLKGNISVRGTLKAFDVPMTIVLENAEQLENGEMKTKFGKVMLRGDSVILVSP